MNLCPVNQVLQHFPISVYFDRSHNFNPLSTEASNLDATLQLYPNSCTDFLELRAGLPLQGIEVYDLHGRQVLQRSNATVQGGNDALRLDVRALPPGMYLLQATGADGRVGVQRFVKGE